MQATPDKRHKLRLVVAALVQTEGRTLVFVQKKRTATWLKKQLHKGGPDDGGPAEQVERTRTRGTSHAPCPRRPGPGTHLW